MEDDDVCGWFAVRKKVLEPLVLKWTSSILGPPIRKVDINLTSSRKSIKSHLSQQKREYSRLV
jgi:hypothetical protein